MNKRDSNAERVVGLRMEIEKCINRIRAERNMGRDDQLKVEIVPHSWQAWRDIVDGIALPFRASAGSIKATLYSPDGG